MDIKYIELIYNLFNKYNYNNNVLIIIYDYINIINNYNYIIKKKNINIYIIINDNIIHKKLLENIKDEECENNINIFNNIENIKNIFFDYINIFQLYSLNILEQIKNIANNNTIICIYTSLSNENTKIINYKN